MVTVRTSDFLPPAARTRAASPWLWGAAVAGVGALLPLGLAWAFTHPPRRLHRRTPRALGIPYFRVRLGTADGLRLSAWYAPAPRARDRRAPRGVVIVCHGYYGNRSCMLPHLRLLHRAGYAALLFDFRAHGWSGGRMATFGCKETLDLKAALDWVAARPRLRHVPVAVLGESMGAAVALLVASEDARVRAVVADSAFARLDAAVAGRLRLLGRVGAWVTPPTQRVGERLLGVRCADIAPEEAIARIAPRPVFLIHGACDTFIGPENAHRLLQAGGGNVTLWEAPGAAHCQCIAVAGQEYGRRVREFLESALPCA